MTYENDSVFGNTICGVPNPLVPHVHPYPTRYHGPWFGTVSQNATYRENPFYQAPSSISGLGGCAACLRGFGADDSTAPLFRSATGSGLADAAIGAAAAAVISRPQDRIMAGILGGMLAYFAGTLGLITGVGAAVYQRQRQGSFT